MIQTKSSRFGHGVGSGPSLQTLDGHGQADAAGPGPVGGLDTFGGGCAQSGPIKVVWFPQTHQHHSGRVGADAL